MVRGIPNITVPAVGYPAVQSGKMSLPVDPSSLLYSHFEHVSGIPAPKGTQGVTISKLNLLDVLIGQLNHGKKADPSFSRTVPAEQLDTLIENYRNQIQQAKSAGVSVPYITSPNTQPGALFSIII